MIPKTVKICGITYDIVEKDLVIVNNGTNYAGSHSLTDSTIELFTGASEQYKEMILAHEILHGIVSATTIDLGDKEEPFVRSMERVFFQFLKDNTNFFEGEKVDQ